MAYEDDVLLQADDPPRLGPTTGDGIANGQRCVMTVNDAATGNHTTLANRWQAALVRQAFTPYSLGPEGLPCGQGSQGGHSLRDRFSASRRRRISSSLMAGV